MHRLMIEVSTQLYRDLLESAQDKCLSLEEECLRRLQEEQRHSHYLLAVVAGLRAEEEQRRASARDEVV